MWLRPQNTKVESWGAFDDTHRTLLLPLSLKSCLFGPVLYLNCEAATCSQVRLQRIRIIGRVDAQNGDELALVESRTHAAVVNAKQWARKASRRRNNVPVVKFDRDLPIVLTARLHFKK